MDAFTLVVSLALVAGAFAVVLYPLWPQTRPEASLKTDTPGQTTDEYQARYQASLNAIKDLMFDYEMGKVSAEDYEKLLTKTKLEAAEFRYQVDRLNHSSNSHSEATFDVEIERLVAQLRSNKFNGYEALLPQVDAEIDLLKKAPFTPAQGEELACPHCHQPYLSGDAFCVACGQTLTQTCSACGYAYQPGDAFCAHCGLALNNQPQPGPHAEVTIG
jgi:hypothetical protein